MSAAAHRTSHEAPASSTRLASIDVFRGLTVVGMLLVNDPGDLEHVYAPLVHSAWHGWTAADLVFPFFLFIVGVTTQLSLTRRETDGADARDVYRGVVRRASIIFGLGLFINAYPLYRGDAVAGPAWFPAPLAHVAAQLEQTRILGVLQRIGIAYLVASFIAYRGATRRVIIAAVVALVGYWALMTLVPVPGEGMIGAKLLDEPSRTLAAWVDRALLDWSGAGLGNHLWEGTVTYDPEGVLSTIPAVGTVLLGVLAGRLLTQRQPATARLAALGAVGALGMMTGSIWGWVFPINKSIWSSSYVVFTAGTACLTLASIAWLVDVMRRERWSRPFLVFGTNPIVAYVGSELLAKVFHSSIKFKLDGRRVGTETAFTRLMESIGAEPRFASLLWAAAFVSLWYLILAQLYRRRIFLRV